MGTESRYDRSMKRDAAEILKEALALPTEARAALAASLLDSLDTDVDEDAEASWATEVTAASRDSIAAPSRPSPGRRSAADWPPADAPRSRLELQPWIDRLAFQREYAKDALVNASEGLSLDEPFEPFDPQCELAQRQRSLPRKPTFTQALEMLGQGVLGPVDDPEVLTAAALHRGLQQATRRGRHEL